MRSEFERVPDRHAQPNINKWRQYPPGVLPLWIADMDFRTPAPVRHAVRRLLDHGVLGYERADRTLLETVAGRLARLYDWQVDPESILPIPGVLAGLASALRALTSPGEGVVVQPPIFPPLWKMPRSLGRQVLQAPLHLRRRASRLDYAVDPDSIERAVGAGARRTRAFVLCNPHNPTGRAYTRAELMAIADAAARHDLLVLSDEIHAELQLGENRHQPIAALADEIAQRSVTFVGAGKTFNVPGLATAFAVIPNPRLRCRLAAELEQSGLEPGSAGLAAARAAYAGEADDWRADMLEYLTGNRDHALRFIEVHLPRLRAASPEATFLLWIDCRAAQQAGHIRGTPQTHFLEHAAVALTAGEDFGRGGRGFVRLNFACPRPVLQLALERMRDSLER